MDHQNELIKICVARLKILVEEKGFELPVTVVIVSPGGNLMGLQFNEHGINYIAAHGPVRDQWSAPMNILYVDSRGKAERYLIPQIGKEPEFIN